VGMQEEKCRGAGRNCLYILGLKEENLIWAFCYGPFRYGFNSDENLMAFSSAPHDY